MDFRLPEEVMSLQTTIKDFCKREIDWKLMSELEKKDNPLERIPWDLIKKLHDLGITTLTIPEKYGGAGAGLLTAGAVAEALGQYGDPLSVLVAFKLKYSLDYANVFNEEQKEEFLPQLVKDYRYWPGISASEPEPTSDMLLPYDVPETMKVFAYRDGDEYVINGEKYHSSCGGMGMGLFYARTDKNAPLSKGTSALIVPTDTPGCTVQRYNTSIGWRFCPDASFYFENCRVPVRYRVGEENEGLAITLGIVSGKVIILGTLVGAAQRIYDLSLERAKTRIGGGRPIIEHTHIGHRLVDMYMCVQAMRLFLYKHLWGYDQYIESVKAGGKIILLKTMDWNVCDIYIRELSLRVLSSACEVFGSEAVSEEFPIEKYIRDTYTSLHAGGTNLFNYTRAMRYL